MIKYFQFGGMPIFQINSQQIEEQRRKAMEEAQKYLNMDRLPTLRQKPKRRGIIKVKKDKEEKKENNNQMQLGKPTPMVGQGGFSRQSMY